MKKILCLSTLLVSMLGFSQAIDVNTSTHTVPQLVNNVLINSPCVSATNITWQTGSNYNSSNGIGYFQNSNPNFPMPSGVILSTGSAQNAEGPNMSQLNDGASGWPGDTDLEATLAAAGISMVSSNATVLEFDFTPISANFSFDFVFASEEYGNFQCQFSDAFAFLLTNVNTGVTTNLAIVPNTTQPISVVTIRDFLYNSSCPSANAQYFGSFNGGSQAAGSATNFNGQTVLLNASSNLIPNTPYHIKLVIADRSDYQSDSAIFISSDSFNIGQDVLGLDHTVATNSSLCFGESFELNTNLSPAEYSFTWTRDGAPIPGQTGPSINVNQPGVYGVTYTNIINNCQPVTDYVTIEYSSQLTTPEPITIYKCDTGSPTYTFDLSLNTPIVSAGIDPAPQITYHLSATDAENNANPLPLNYVSAGNQTIYVKIKNVGNACYVVKSFQLVVTPAAIANQPPNLEKCARSLTLNNALFNLNPQTPIVLGTQSAAINSISYYTSLTNAQSGINPISNLNFALLSSMTIYVRVQNVTDPSCFAITNFDVIILPVPQVDEFEDLILCEPYVLPPLTNGSYFTGNNGTGTPMFAGEIIAETQTIYIFNQPDGPTGCGSGSHFQIKILDPNTISPAGGTFCGSYTLPPLEAGDYFSAPGGTGTTIPVGTQILESQTIYVYYETETEPFCVIDKDFEVTILPTPQIGTFTNVFDCVSYTLPVLPVGNYFTAANGQGTQIPAGTVITQSQTIYVYAALPNELVCSASASFDVVIGFTMPPDISQCNPYTLPPLVVGNYYTGPNGSGTQIAAGTVISQSQTMFIHVPNTNTPNCAANIHFDIAIAQPYLDPVSDVTVCNSYTLPVLNFGNYYTEINGGGTMLNAGDVIIANQTIHVFAASAGNCNNDKSFNVIINQPPPIDSRSDIDVCNSYVLTALTVGDYYTGPDGTGTLLAPGTVITETQTIYIYAISDSTPPCVAQNSFVIDIFPLEADDPADVIACDSYVLQPLTIGNYYLNSGGPSANLTALNAGDVITSTTTLYIYTESGERINCNDENIFNVTINQTPVIAAIANSHTCNTYTLPALTLGNYYTGPGATGTMLNAGDVLTSTQTVYVYAETGTTPNCSDEKSFVVDIFSVDELADITTCETYVLPALTIGKYYTGPGGTGTMLPAGTAINVSKTIYIYAVSPFAPSCFDESSFEITIVDTPVANSVPVTMTRVCDEDGTNDGITVFDLTSLDSTVLGSQTGAEFSVEYYENTADANAGINSVTSTTLATIIVRVSNALAPNCYALRTVTITVSKLPEPTPVDGIICFDSETQTLLSPYTISSGLGSGHTFEWKNELGNVVGTASNYTATTPGTYTVTATRTLTGCVSEPVSVVVAPSEPAIVTYTVSEDFADEQSITVIATGTGDYEYQLDLGGFQDSPVFDHVSSGMHTVTVRDKNGCGNSVTEALVINYPHYFTPNGDGIHDTWNIKDLRTQSTAKVNIYDRYGKLIALLKTSGEGWDGTFNGAHLPSTDYWFVVTYDDEGGIKREFRAHFAMKR